jgi:hypothetical protein
MKVLLRLKGFDKIGINLFEIAVLALSIKIRAPLNKIELDKF